MSKTVEMNMRKNEIYGEICQLQKECVNLKTAFQNFYQEFERTLLNIQSEIQSTTKADKEKVCDGVYRIQPIGIFHSCFLTKNGTPRQPSLCKYARGTLKVTYFLNSFYSLVDIESYSHLWILFIFHKDLEKDHKLRSKVAPPRLNGAKVGVYSTRSPHRPNRLGLSLVKLDKVEADTLYLSGLDLVDGTPVVDIKPYISDYDIPPEPSSHPRWINAPPTSRVTVEFTEAALTDITTVFSGAHQHKMRFIRSEGELKQSITDIIEADPRSVYRKRQGNVEFSFPLDTIDVYVKVSDSTLIVTGVKQSESMSKLPLFQKIAHPTPEKSRELVSVSEAVLTSLNGSAVVQLAAIERLFYLVMILENLENKVRRGAIVARDPVKVDLEVNLKKCLEVVCENVRSDRYDYRSCCFIVKLCFETFAQVNDSFRLFNQLQGMLLLVSDHMYKMDPDSYVEKMFDIFTSLKNPARGGTLAKVLNPHPDLIPEVMRRCYVTFTKKEANFQTFSSLIAQVSQYNSKTVSASLMDLLKEDANMNQKLRFVINILRSIPTLQSVSIMLLYESKSFETLMTSPVNTISPSLLDDLAKLFIYSHVNSYSTVMSLLERRSNQALGPRLLEKILLNIELAIFSSSELNDREMCFLDNMSSPEDVVLLCRGLEVLSSYTHPYLLKILFLLSLYRGKVLTSTIVSELLVTQPYERFQSYVNIITGVHPNILTECFKKTLKNLPSVNFKPGNIAIFLENADKMKLTSSCDLSSEDIITIAQILKDTTDYKLIHTLLTFLEPKPRALSTVIYVCKVMIEKYLRIALTITNDTVTLEVLEMLEELKTNLTQWGAVNSSIRITVLRHLLSLATADDLFYEDEIEEELELQENRLVDAIRSGNIKESSDLLHSGQIVKRQKCHNKQFTDSLGIQQVMNLIQSLHHSSPKAVDEIANFILDEVCSDCNLQALWPDEEAMKYTLERDLVVVRKFQDHAILWNILEEALTSKKSELVVIIRAMLTAFIAFWSNSWAKKCSEQPDSCAQTVKVLDLLSKESWVPLPLHNISQLIPIIAPFEARLLLLEVWHHLRLHQPHVSGFPTNRCQATLKKTILTIVQNNIENVGVTAFLFSRWNLIEVVE